MTTRANRGTRRLCLSVVVIDDEADVAAYLAAVLERSGHRVRIAETAAEGFDLIKRLRPDVACLDVVMPEETGVALLKRIRGDADIGATPVVFITALKPELTTWPTTPEGPLTPDEFVEKPPKAESFVAAVERAARARGGVS